MLDAQLLAAFGGDELAASTWRKKYALKNKNKVVMEKTPREMHRRMARAFAKAMADVKIDKHLFGNLSPEGRRFIEEFNSEENAFHRFYALFKDFKYIIPGGSAMAMLGNIFQVGSLSNCFVAGQPKDNISSIWRFSERQAQLMKRRGGVGIDLALLRPRGVAVNNAAETSTGAASFMQLYSTSTQTVAQDGRRGALMLSIPLKHPDSREFIDIKSDLTLVTGANVSVKVENEFMDKLLEGNDTYAKVFPTDTIVDSEQLRKYQRNVLLTLPNSNPKIHFKVVNPKEEWDNLMQRSWASAEPGILFHDALINNSPDGVYDAFRYVSTNPCVTGDTEVLTKQGYVKMTELVDKNVEIWNGFEWSFADAFKTSDGAEIYRVKFSDGSELDCTEYHRFILPNGAKEELRNLSVGTKLSKFKLPIIELPDSIKSTKDMYTYGFFCGDGTIGHKDRETKSYYIDLYGEKLDLKKFLCISGNHAYDAINDSQRFNVPFECEKDFVPNEQYCKRDRLDFLAGIIDSDGCLNTPDGGISISSNYRDFLMKLKKMLITLGTHSKVSLLKAACIKEIKGKSYECADNFRLVISSNAVMKLAHQGLKTHRVPLLTTSTRETTQYLKITSINHIGKEATYCVNEPKNHTAMFEHIMTGNCGEIPMQPNDSCRLIHINMVSFIKNAFKNNATFNLDKFKKIIYTMCWIADLMIDLEIKAIENIMDNIPNTPDDVEELQLWESIKKQAIEGRRCGMGFTGLADAIAMLGLKFGAESVDFISELMKVKMEVELNAGIDMAILRGPFTGYKPDLEYKDVEGHLYGKNEFFINLHRNFPELVDKMVKFGRRNISWSTVAPTGTVSLMTKTSSGIEPVFGIYYMRRRKCNEGDPVHSVDADGIPYMHFNVIHHAFKEWLYTYLEDNDIIPAGESKQSLMNNMDLIPAKDLDEYIKLSPWHGCTAPELAHEDRIAIQGAVQDYTTHSISSTVNLPSTCTPEEIGNIFVLAYNRGLKGITVYRDGSRNGILVNHPSGEVEEGIDSRESKTIIPHSAPKRPKKLEAKMHIVRYKGRKYALVVGLLEQDPYEIFCFELVNESSHKNGDIYEGITTKVKKGHYDFETDKFIFENLQLLNDREIERISTITTSLSLRHGVPLKYVTKALGKTSGSIKDFTSVMARVLSSYQGTSKEVCSECGGEVRNEAGCKICLSCGDSKCS